jgi:Protein of unknown function (DUF3306)
MSENEDFLARWSRRKGEARTGQSEPEPSEPVEASSPPASEASTAQPDAPDVDLSSMPPIELINAATDITAFLRKGIPQELTRAALRQAWTADPAVRDFVGLAENAWDFNDPTAMPGFGPLDCSQAELSALADKIVGNLRQADMLPTVIPEVQTSGDEAPPDCGPAEETGRVQTADAPVAEPSVVSDGPGRPAASQSASVGRADDQAPVPRRTHGGALPR